ncbi:TIGR03617 family F420-dependent LLM class oxidoreductase [Parahaliea sp. F7430]|uniref:TIGR03617 family F420-dependent LLM class oxidoreductase n=1 Tax=Sediminihaliea albiluteola TaxID=2758564 RepID=A0A7W2YKH4_9GAMM|nr:TIGR03617 family F420-dependent LLM class oxidoreductase [Sediminihaliea albiluteola]MBA6413358.1 TIGR03617 family F420-dependent LLM class oxidoreductase [Sediminihaliea albiluteola]
MKIDTSLMFDPVKIAEIAPELEKAGFDGAYAFEGQSDPFIGISVAAMKSQRMDLMTSIAVAFARNPMSLAYLANDLQQLSQGRFILGLGSQVKAHIERRYSMPWSKPAARMREMVQAIRAIWHSWDSGERLNFKGEFYQHSLMSPTFSPAASELPRPKIFVAGVGPRMTEVAAEVADGYFIHPFHSTTSIDAISMPALQRGLDKADKSMADLELSAQVITATGLSDEALQAAIFSARSQIAFYASTPAYLPVLEAHGWEGLQPEMTALSKAGKWAEMAAKINDEVLTTFAVVGKPDEVAAQLVQRCHGLFDRISPVVYAPDTELLIALLSSIKSTLAKA